jgi:small subunit ribosomal protein S20
LKKTVSYINKAASKGVIHKNNAARKVSRLSKKVHSSLQGKA